MKYFDDEEVAEMMQDVCRATNCRECVFRIIRNVPIGGGCKYTPQDRINLFVELRKKPYVVAWMIQALTRYDRFYFRRTYEQYKHLFRTGVKFK